MTTEEIRLLYREHVLDLASRRLTVARGAGTRLWDNDGREYLDFGGGIAVNALGHAHPALTAVLAEQSQRIAHASNLYFNEWQARYAAAINGLVGRGKVFFTNSGAESDEALFKFARRHGSRNGRFEIITAFNSFHGRTLAGIAATAQEKFRKGFGPVTPGFVHVPFNNLEAVAAAITDRTAAVMIEGIQGEGGVHPAMPDYLTGLRRLTRERGLLLLFDAVQCGGFRTGRFQSYERLLEGRADASEFLPDAIAMAKSLGGGFPLGAAWISSEHEAVMDAGSHGTTFGGSPLACAVGLTVLEVVRTERLDDNIRRRGDELLKGLGALVGNGRARAVRGLGGLIGLELAAPAPEAVTALSEQGLIVVGAGPNVLRYLPPLNVTADEIARAVAISAKVLR